MKSLALLLALAALPALAPLPVAAQDLTQDQDQDQSQDSEVSFQFFYDSLTPYGQWLQVGDYGMAWHPADVGHDWAPYTDGYWSYTDAGWTWVSYEDYGGIVYHYGRWVSTDDVGWCWVPDYQWAPAWVSWRNNDDYVGWAPLPPECHWQADVGVSVWADTTYDIGPGCYHFCRVGDFGAPVIASVLLPQAQNVVFIRNTVNVTNITYNNASHFIVVGGPRYEYMRQHVNRPFPLLKVVRQTNINNVFVAGHRPFIQTIQKGNALFMVAPRVKYTENPLAAIPHFTPDRVVSTAHVSHGWSMVKGEEARAHLQAEFRSQSKGLTPQNSPARLVDAAALRIAPQKINVEPPARGGSFARLQNAEGFEAERGHKGREGLAGANPGQPSASKFEPPVATDDRSHFKGGGPSINEPIANGAKISRQGDGGGEKPHVAGDGRGRVQVEEFHPRQEVDANGGRNSRPQVEDFHPHQDVKIDANGGRNSHPVDVQKPQFNGNGSGNGGGNGSGRGNGGVNGNGNGNGNGGGRGPVEGFRPHQEVNVDRRSLGENQFRPPVNSERHVVNEEAAHHQQAGADQLRGQISRSRDVQLQPQGQPQFQPRSGGSGSANVFQGGNNSGSRSGHHEEYQQQQGRY